uniref:Uncharacterized protein n=1 Tax=Cyprinus carpio TaxID=7962 RepID=A0A8C2HUA4_CYPCA
MYYYYFAMTLIFKNMNVFFFSIYTAVIKVFKGEELQPNELYYMGFLSEIISRCFNIQLFVLAQVWNKFFTSGYFILSAGKSGQELTVRQMALLGFRDLVLMKLSLDDLLRKNLSLIPASITQMLLVLQVNESRGPSKEYYQLESPVARVVKLELQTHKISHYISEGSLLSHVEEQEGEVVTNAHSGIQLLTVTSKIYAVMDHSCETVDPGLAKFQNPS